MAGTVRSAAPTDSGYGTAVADEQAGGATDDEPDGGDDELAARLADIHRRSEELAERVANFRSDTEQFATGATSDESSDQPDQPERRHRPRPTASAPLIYEDDADPDPEAEAQPEAQPKAAPETAPEPSPAPEQRQDDPPKDDQRTTDQAKDEQKPAKRGMPSWLRKVRNLVITVVIVVAAALALRAYVVEPFYVPSASMEPTLHGCPNCNNDHVLVQKVSYYFHDPRRGDIVVFDRPSNWQVPDSKLIKRVIGVAGDKVVLRRGKVYVNGAQLEESYVNKKCRNGTRPENRKSSWKVPKNRLFVMGDNRCDSEDSRTFGMVPVDNVIGKAFLIYWPVKDFGSP
jgi:signal peptidase I